MQLTQKIKIEPTKEQIIVLKDLSEKCRLIYNFGLQDRKLSYENKQKITYIDQQNKLPSIKEQWPEYKMVYSKVLQYVLRTLDANYKSFFELRKNGDKDAMPPGFKGNKYFTTMVYNQSGFKYENSHIILSHKHPNKIPLKFKIPEKFYFDKISQISIYEKKKKYYISVTYEKSVKVFVQNNLYQAFDLGINKQSCVNSYGKFKDFINPRIDKYWNKPIKILQSRRDKYKKHSRRWEHLNNCFHRCNTKYSNQLIDYQHKLSRKIVNNTKASTIIVGDLDIKKMSKLTIKNTPKYEKMSYKDKKIALKKEKTLHHSLQSTGYISRLVHFLTYKSELVGKRTIKDDESYTSLTCCCCGKIKKKLPVSERIYKCDCGNLIDRDRNSSINIMKRFLSKNASWAGYQQFVDNLRKQGICIDIKFS